MPLFDYRELTDRIHGMGGPKHFCRAVFMTPARLARILDGDAEFTQSEIARAAAYLQIGADGVDRYFFTLRVQKN